MKTRRATPLLLITVALLGLLPFAVARADSNIIPTKTPTLTATNTPVPNTPVPTSASGVAAATIPPTVTPTSDFEVVAATPQATTQPVFSELTTLQRCLIGAIFVVAVLFGVLIVYWAYQRNRQP
jgi:hypothetical protein